MNFEYNKETETQYYVACINPHIQEEIGYFHDCTCLCCDYNCITAHTVIESEFLKILNG